eukprot:Nk52_evm69s270 gene=Nk52_evmTU69s270
MGSVENQETSLKEALKIHSESDVQSLSRKNAISALKGKNRSEIEASRYHSRNQSLGRLVSQENSPVIRNSVLTSNELQSITNALYARCEPGKNAAKKTLVVQYSKFSNASMLKTPHFHYTHVDVPRKNYGIILKKRARFELFGEYAYIIEVVAGNTSWSVRRAYFQFAELDEQLHQCSLSRDYSALPIITNSEGKELPTDYKLLSIYIERLNDLLPHGLMLCSRLLGWLGVSKPDVQLNDVDNNEDGKRGRFRRVVRKWKNNSRPDEHNALCADEASKKKSKNAERKPSPVHKEPKKKKISKERRKSSSKKRCFEVKKKSKKNKKTKNSKSGINLFGRDLAEYLCSINAQVPPMVVKLTAFIEHHGLREGLYRISGIKSNVNKLRIALEKDDLRCPNPSFDTTAATNNIASHIDKWLCDTVWNVLHRETRPTSLLNDSFDIEEKLEEDDGSFNEDAWWINDQNEPTSKTHIRANQSTDLDPTPLSDLGITVKAELLRSVPKGDVPIDPHPIIKSQWRMITSVRLSQSEDILASPHTKDAPSTRRRSNVRDDLDASDHNIATITGVIKLYFRSLPNPLVPFSLYSHFIKIGEGFKLTKSKTKLTTEELVKIKNAVKRLPPPNSATLEYLISHLSRISTFEEKTKMTSKTLAIIWGPNVFRSPSNNLDSITHAHIYATLIEAFMIHRKEIFACPHY